MTEQEFRAAVERYKAELLRVAAQNGQSGQTGNTVGTRMDAPEGITGTAPDPDSAARGGSTGNGAEVNPPEANTQGDDLQDYAPQPDTYRQFQRVNTETGFLRIQAFSGQQAVPIRNADVLVSHTFADGIRRYASGRTDESGVLDSLALPAPLAALSESPSGQMPFALYDIRVSHPNYRTEFYRNVPIFAGIKAIQPVRFMADGTGPMNPAAPANRSNP